MLRRSRSCCTGINGPDPVRYVNAVEAAPALLLPPQTFSVDSNVVNYAAVNAIYDDSYNVDDNEEVEDNLRELEYHHVLY